MKKVWIKRSITAREKRLTDSHLLSSGKQSRIERLLTMYNLSKKKK